MNPFTEIEYETETTILKSYTGSIVSIVIHLYKIVITEESTDNTTSQCTTRTLVKSWNLTLDED